MIKTMVLGGILAMVSVEDIRTKQVNLAVLCIGAIMAALFQFCGMGSGLPDMLAGILPGVAVLAFSWWSKGKIGAGDGAVLMMTGLFLGWRSNIALLFCAVMLAGIYGMALLCLKRKKKDEEIAFVPFLGLGYLLICVGKAGVTI